MADSWRGIHGRLAAFAMLASLCAAAVFSLAAAAPVSPDAGGPGIFVSTRGDNRNDGSSPGRALRTIAAGLARARPGDTVQIEGGTYREQVVTVRPGDQDAEIVLRSFNGIARIDGSALKWSSGRNQNQGLVELRHPFIRMVGLAVVNSRNTGILLDASDLTVEDCLVAETRLHGISTETRHQTRPGDEPGAMIRRITLRGNTVERAALAGRSQAVSLIADGFLVSGNTVRDSPKEGIDIWLGSRRGSVEGNTIYGNAAVGIYVDGAAYVSITRNTVYSNLSGIGISSEDARYNTHDIWVFNNIVRDNRRDGVFLWDDDRKAGFRGSQNVLIAHNTLLRNGTGLRFSGGGNSGWAIGNLGYSSEQDVFFDPRHSRSVLLSGNVWLASPAGFVSLPRLDLHLGAQSLAIGRATAIPPITTNPAINALISKDFDGNFRPAQGADAGAFQYRRAAPAGT
ncbi:MAG: nitrous oxide reductase family maturation protein NosD [Novosphingobium sp.]